MHACRYFFILTACCLLFSSNAICDKHTEDKQEVTILYGLDKSFPPYEYVNADGKIVGFNIDLMKAIAEDLGFNIRFVAKPWPQIYNLVANKSDSITITSMYYSKKRDQIVDYAITHTFVFHGIFVRRNTKPIKSLEALNGKLVAVQKSSYAEEYLSTNYPNIKLFSVLSEVEAVKAVSKGLCNFAVVSNAVGEKSIEILGLENLASTGPSIMPVEYTITVPEGNSELLYYLNRGLNNIRTSGKYAIIYNRWFPAPKSIGREILKYGLWVFAPLALILLVVVTWNRTLKIQVSNKTDELMAELVKRKKAEKELRFKKTAIDSSTSAFVFTDPNWKIVEVNKAALSFWGYQKAEQLINHHFSSIFFRKNQIEKIIKVINKKGEFKGDVEALRPDGSTFYCLLSASRIHDKKNDKACTMCYMEDITRRKKAEDTIKELNKELEERVRIRTYQLEEVNQELEAFNYSISHDLAAPLRAIKEYIRILKDEKVETEKTKVIEYIENNAANMEQLIADLLHFSRVGKEDIKFYQLDMQELVDSVISELKLIYDKFPAINIALLHNAKADPSLIRQVWQNLLSNAIKFSRHKPDALVEVGSYKTNQHMVVYYVKDNGIGIDAERSDEIFGVFQRLHTAEQYEGTGIGLALAKRIVQRHGGSIWAEGEPDKGATFYFSLPTTQNPVTSVAFGKDRIKINT